VDQPCKAAAGGLPISQSTARPTHLIFQRALDHRDNLVGPAGPRGAQRPASEYPTTPTLEWQSCLLTWPAGRSQSFHLHWHGPVPWKGTSMVITAIGHVLLALAVLAVLAFCCLTAGCLSLRRPRPSSRSTSTETTIAGTETAHTASYAGSALFRRSMP